MSFRAGIVVVAAAFTAFAPAASGTPPLTITAPAGISTPSTQVCGTTHCAAVDFAFTVSGGTAPYHFVCNFYSGDLFTVGSHRVTCVAYDSDGNTTRSASFTVTVTAPPFTPPPPHELTAFIPSAISTPATQLCNQIPCAPASYTIEMTGGVPPYHTLCNLGSGQLFLLGMTTIQCLGSDSVGNGTPPIDFEVTVTAGAEPVPPPPPGTPSLAISSVPANISVSATTPCVTSYCAPVGYTLGITGGIPPYHLVCNLDSGQLFTIGVHNVTCIAQDSEGDSTPVAGFGVTVIPAVNSFTPASAPAGSTVTITGRGFTGTTSVAFGGVLSPSFHVDSATQITATVPVDAPSGVLMVTASAVTGFSAGSFISLASVVRGVRPAQGAVGARVTITGSKFTGASEVDFGGVGADYTVDSDSVITATVPPGAATGPVTVATGGGGSSSESIFTVVPATAPVPVIASFTPSSAPRGARVLIRGSGFTGATAVTIKGVRAAFLVVGDGLIYATVPVGTGSGPIAVTTPGGTATSTASFSFR